jgi:hypothetical protein
MMTQGYNKASVEKPKRRRGRPPKVVSGEEVSSDKKGKVDKKEKRSVKHYTVTKINYRGRIEDNDDLMWTGVEGDLSSGITDPEECQTYVRALAKSKDGRKWQH